MSSYEAGIKERAYNAGYNAGVINGNKELWGKIQLAIDNPGGYSLLYNAVNGTPEHPEGFGVEVRAAKPVHHCMPMDRSQIDWGDYDGKTDKQKRSN